MKQRHGLPLALVVAWLLVPMVDIGVAMAQAEITQARFMLSTPVSVVHPGDSFDIELSIEDIDLVGVNTWQIALQVDPSLVTVTGFAPDTSFWQGCAFMLPGGPVWQAAESEYQIAHACFGGIHPGTGGHAATIHVQATGDGLAHLDLDIDEIVKCKLTAGTTDYYPEAPNLEHTQTFIADYIWSGTSGTDWDLTDNWDPAGTPAGEDSAAIPGSLTSYPVLNINASIHTLMVAEGGQLDIPAAYALSAEVVHSYGSITMQRNVPGGMVTPFHVLDTAGSPAFSGVDVTPDSDMGITAVTIQSHQLCPEATRGIRRCFDLTPGLPGPAEVRFYYTEAERNGVDNDNTMVYHWSSTQWIHESGTYSRGGSDDNWWVGVTNVDNFSAFALGDGGVTAVAVSGFRAMVNGAQGVLLTWDTVSEVDVLGFDIYRADSQNGTPDKINAELIPARQPGSPIGDSYSWLDDSAAPGNTFYYWLKVLDLEGGESWVGPASLDLPPIELYRIYLPLIHK